MSIILPPSKIGQLPFGCRTHCGLDADHPKGVPQVEIPIETRWTVAVHLPAGSFSSGFPTPAHEAVVRYVHGPASGTLRGSGHCPAQLARTHGADFFTSAPASTADVAFPTQTSEHLRTMSWRGGTQLRLPSKFPLPRRPLSPTLLLRLLLSPREVDGDHGQVVDCPHPFSQVGSFLLQVLHEL